MSTRTGGACLCGAVAFAIAPPYRWFAHCHCSMCRKHHGTLFGSGLGVARTNLEWLRGAERVVHYRASAAFERPFCRECGSTVPAVSHDERFWHVPAGLLDGDPGVRPRSHIFAAAKSELYELDDALPKHAAYPPGIRAPIVERPAPGAPGAAITGSCLCGGVAFGVAALARRVVHCHCSPCRHASGGAFTSTLRAAASDFRWLRGAARLRGNAVPEPRHCARGFCADCGSPAPSAAEDGTVMLPAGALDTRLPALPAVHAYVGDKAPWVSIADPWPQFDGPPPSAELSDSFR